MPHFRNLAAGALALVSMLCIAASAAAQQDDVRAELDRLRQRIAELETRQQEQVSQQIQREELLKVIGEMKADADNRTKLPGWLEGLKFSGDLRLRYQADCWETGGQWQPKPRHRARFRLRFGVTKTWLDDQVEFGFRLASGEYSQNASSKPNIVLGSDATSTNQTFTDLFSEKPIWIDLAYAQYMPNWFKGLRLVGGKMKNPFVSSDIIWDSDVNPEGVYAEYKMPGLGNVEPFAGAGFFILRESATGTDSTMGGYQAGVTWKPVKDVKWMVAGLFYDYKDFDQSGASRRGNNTLADVGGFGIAEVVTRLDWKMFELPWSAYFDYAHNCREDDATPGYTNQNDAWAVGLLIGQNKKKGDWSLGYKYAVIEPNAVVGHFADADYGFANRKGHGIRGQYNLTDWLTAGLNVYLTRPIVRDAIQNNIDERRLVTVQADLVWKF